MKIKKINLKGFKRFHNLTLDLGPNPKKIVALVGPNGSGKSAIFDAFEIKASETKGSKGGLREDFFAKSSYSTDITEKYSAQRAINITVTPKETHLSKKSFMIRSSYRFTGKLNVTKLTQKPDILDDSMRPASSIDLDSRLIDNYERLMATVHEMVMQGDKTGNQIKEEIIGNLNRILTPLLGLRVSDVGNILVNGKGCLFFDKGKSQKFPFDNLSSGEKEVVDILLDLIIKKESHDETIYCIDEPELHLNTSIQRKLLIAIATLIPPNCQLWIATHSIGFLRALQSDLRDESQIIDFSTPDFDTEVILEPIILTRAKWRLLFKTALEDLTDLVAPKILIYCEGRKQPGIKTEEKGLDAIVLNTIFGADKYDAHFVSSGGSTEPDMHSTFGIMVLSKAIPNVQILLLKDKDIKGDGSETTSVDRDNWLQKNLYHRMLKRKEIENYLFDYAVVKKAYPHITQDEYQSVIKDCLTASVKEATGKLKGMCGVGNTMNSEIFKIHLSTFLSPDMTVYQELANCIFLE